MKSNIVFLFPFWNYVYMYIHLLFLFQITYFN